jgi:cytochrome P450
MQAGLSASAIKHYEVTILETISRWVKTLCVVRDGEWDDLLEFAESCDRLTFDLTTRIVFSQDYDLTTKEDHRDIVEALIDSHLRVGVISWCSAIGKWKIDRLLFTKSLLQAKKSLIFLYSVYRNRMKSEKFHQPDLFSYLLNFVDPETGEGLTKRELRAEVPLLLVAGEYCIPAKQSILVTRPYFQPRIPPQRRSQQYSSI